jgi:hypothetical protein
MSVIADIKKKVQKIAAKLVTTIPTRFSETAEGPD